MLRLLLFALLVFAPSNAWAKKNKPKDTTTEDEKDAEQVAAEEEEERKRKEKLARVIVLKWPETSTDFADETVRRNVRSRIGRPEAMFFPEVDLYQNGRKLLDRTVIPSLQPAVVPDSNVPGVLSSVDEVSGIPWDGLPYEQWGLTAKQLVDDAEQIWFVDRVELREPLFLLYAQIGRAAENQNHPAPPFYEQIGPFAVNYYWYLAATLAYQEPSLLSKVTDNDVRKAIEYYVGELQKGSYPSFKIDFEQENSYDEEWFNATYEIRINGLPVELDGNGQLDAFLGRTDIYLKRKDTGHGLSERLEVSKLDEKIYFVRDVARKRMGVDFIDQLFLHPNECYPELDGDILNFLAIYAKLHNKAEVYIAVPENGNPNKVWIWRYMRDRAMLQLVGGGPDGFPVRFAFLVSSGLMFNGASVEIDTSGDQDGQSINPSTQTIDPGDLTGRYTDANLKNAFLPVNFELRGHYNRLMVNLGGEFGYNTAPDSVWVERYWLPKHQGLKAKARPTGDQAYEVDGEGNVTIEEAYHVTAWNRYMYIGTGVVFGRDAGIGFGPRLALRSGWTNLPRAWQTSGHFGWAIQPPIGKFGGRVRPMIDGDFRVGVSVPGKESLHREMKDDDGAKEAHVRPVFGLTIGIGTTF